MSKEQELSNAIDAYLAKSAMPFPKGQDRYGLPKKEDSMKPLRWDDVKSAARKASDKLGITKPEDEFKEIHKAKPKVLKPGSPEHTKVMAEMEATKAAKPKSTNPAGEESPSAAGSRDRLGDRPLVAFDKADGLNKYEEVPTEKIGGKMGGGSKQTSRIPELPNPVSRDMKPRPAEGIDKQDDPAVRAKSFADAEAARATWTPEQRRRNNPLYGRNPDTPDAAFPKMTAADKEMFTQNATTKPMGPFTKSVDLEDGSHSWDYQG